MSPRRNWDSPNPSLASKCAPPPGTKGEGAHSPAGEGLGESQFRWLEKSLALCLLCGTLLSIMKTTLEILFSLTLSGRSSMVDEALTATPILAAVESFFWVSGLRGWPKN